MVRKLFDHCVETHFHMPSWRDGPHSPLPLRKHRQRWRSYSRESVGYEIGLEITDSAVLGLAAQTPRTATKGGIGHIVQSLPVPELASGYSSRSP